MRKILLLMIALLAGGVSGAWATTPNILALPQPGKIYYIAGSYDSGNTKAYLYYDSSASALRSSSASFTSGDFAYLWLCTSDGTSYQFQNLSTKKYLGKDGMSASAVNFSVTKDVTDANCVALVYKNASGDDVYMACDHKNSATPQALNHFTGSKGYTAQWTSDYLLEEYAAKTLSHNQYYYIYCDNDDSETTGTDRRQYIYNGTSATIPVQTDESQVTLSSYAWRAIRYYDSSNPTNDYFYFKNGTKYIGWHSLSNDAYQWYTNKNTSVIGAGRVMLWGSYSGGRYMAFNYNDTESSNSGGYSNADTGLPKSKAWSQDFMFLIAPQTNVHRVAIQVEGASDADAVFTYDGFDYSGDCSIYVDGNNMPGTTNISLKSSNSDYTFVGFFEEDGTSLGSTIDVSSLSDDKGVYARFYPFKLSTDFANANWYYLKVKDKWATVDPYPGSEDDPVPYKMYDEKQISGNALWAFVDFSGDGFYMVNYAKGSSKKLDFFTPATFETSNGYTRCYIKWDGNNAYIYNAPSDPWYLIANSDKLSTAQSKDNGAITLEAVDWGELAKAKIDEYYESHAPGEYLGTSTELVTSTKASITAMGSSFTKANFEAMDLSGLIKYPTSGFYRIKSSGNRPAGAGYITYGEVYPSYGNSLIVNPSGINDLSSIIRLTKVSNGVYTLSTQGLNVQTTTESNKVLANGNEAVNYTIAQAAPGYASIGSGEGRNYFHEANWTPSGYSYNPVVGWDAPSSSTDAGAWIIEDVEDDLSITLNSGGDTYYYATFCAPFSYTVTGATAYTLALDGSKSYLVPTPIDGEVTAGTPVLLKGTSGTATLTIGTGYAATPLTTTALEGTYLSKDVSSINSSAYFLGLAGDPEEIGFYHWAGTTLGANRAYLPASALSAKGVLINWDAVDGIESIGNEQFTKDDAIFNLSGQRLNRVQKGVNIVNGKKVLVK